MCCREKVVFFITKIHVRDYKQETVGINSILKWVCKKNGKSLMQPKGCYLAQWSLLAFTTSQHNTDKATERQMLIFAN